MGTCMRLMLPDLEPAETFPPRPCARGHLVSVALALSIAGNGGGAISPVPVYFNRSRAINSTT